MSRAPEAAFIKRPDFDAGDIRISKYASRHGSKMDGQFQPGHGLTH
jgi:hypothetical protein